MEKAKKQTRRVLSLKERLDVIRLAESQQDPKELARIFDCGHNQIRMIIQQKDRLLKEFINNGDPNRQRQRASPFGVAINKMVAEWVHRARAAQIPIDDSVLTERGYQARKFFVFHDFRPNKRWLDRFKRRFRFDDLDMKTPDPKLKSDKPRSLNWSDIFDDIKHTLDTSVTEVMEKRAAARKRDENMSDSPVDQSALVDQSASSNNDKSEAQDYHELSCQMESFNEVEIKEEVMAKHEAARKRDENMSDSLVDQSASSNNDKSEAKDYDELSCQMESFSEVEIKEEADGNAESEDVENADDSMENQNTCSDNERSEGADCDEFTSKLESSEEEVGDDAIKTNEQALECVKSLEEYSMLKGNYRAIGLIIQLEQLYKRQIEE